MKINHILVVAALLLFARCEIFNSKTKVIYKSNWLVLPWEGPNAD
jgi:hypothetical protein